MSLDTIRSSISVYVMQKQKGAVNIKELIGPESDLHVSFRLYL